VVCIPVEVVDSPGLVVGSVFGGRFGLVGNVV
jgi:copper oxidase (laccase) domain-containing protein